MENRNSKYPGDSSFSTLPGRSGIITIISLVIMAAGVTAMTIWISNASVQQSTIWRFFGVKFNTSFCLTLFSITLLLTQYPNLKFRKQLLVALPLAATCIAALGLAEYLFHIYTGIDEFFVREPIIYSKDYPIPGRMSFNTSLDLVLLGFGLLVAQVSRKRSFQIISQGLFQIVAALGAVGIIGYLYGVSLYHSVLYVSPMDMHTSVMFFMLAIAAILLNPSVGMVKLFLGKQIGYMVTRQLFALIAILVILYGIAGVQIQKSGVVSMELGTAVMVVCFLVVLAAVLWFVAKWMNKADYQRTKAEEEVRSINADLEKRVQERSAEIHKKEERYRLLIEQASDAIYVVTLKSDFIDANNKMCQMTGYSREELLHMNVADIIDPDELETDPLPHNMPGTQGVIRERKLKRKDGTLFTAEVNAKTFADGLVLVIARDITERKIAERQLLESEERYRLLFYNSPSPIWVYDFETFQILDVNDVALTTYGYSRDEFLGMTIYDLRPEEDIPLVKDILESVRNKHGISHFGIYTHLRKDKTLIKADVTGYRLDYHGKDCMMVVCSDVTEREEALAKLKVLNERLQKQAKDLKMINSELEQFAYVASHDLQEPLRMITSFLSRLEIKYGSLLDEKGRQYIYFATDGAKRMRRLILDLLEFSRVGRTETKIEEVDANQIVNEAITLCKGTIDELKADISYSNLPILRTHKTPLLQIFQNLISNSLKYHKKGVRPIIGIGYRETASAFEFSIEDNGIGIDSAYFDRIFIVFQRLHNKTEYSGTGMGLAISKKIIEGMGGKIWVDSAEGKGSTFYFTIPKNPKR